MTRVMPLCRKQLSTSAIVYQTAQVYCAVCHSDPGRRVVIRDCKTQAAKMIKRAILISDAICLITGSWGTFTVLSFVTHAEEGSHLNSVHSIRGLCHANTHTCAHAHTQTASCQNLLSHMSQSHVEGTPLQGIVSYPTAPVCQQRPAPQDSWEECHHALSYAPSFLTFAVKALLLFHRVPPFLYERQSSLSQHH